MQLDFYLFGRQRPKYIGGMVMKTRFQLGLVVAVFVVAGVFCSAVSFGVTAVAKPPVPGTTFPPKPVPVPSPCPLGTHPKGMGCEDDPVDIKDCAKEDGCNKNLKSCWVDMVKKKKGECRLSGRKCSCIE